MLSALVRWWLSQLADLLPDRWRRWWEHDVDAVVIAPLGTLPDRIEALDVTLRRNGRETPLGRYRLNREEAAGIARTAGKPVMLRLDENEVLSKTVNLPLAAERHLRQALAFEMDRETPFAAEEVFWSHRIARRDHRAGQIWVRLLIVPRSKLSGLIEALTRMGVPPNWAEIAAGPDRGGRLLLQDHDSGGGYSPRRWLRRAAFAACAVLALLAIALPFARETVALAKAERQVSAARGAVAEAQALRQEIERLAASAALVDAERAKSGGLVAALAALTRLLPADTYLTGLVQEQGTLTITGRSASASRLIGILAADTALRNPAFAAPVTRLGEQRPGMLAADDALRHPAFAASLTRLDEPRLDVFTISVEITPSPSSTPQ